MIDHVPCPVCGGEVEKEVEQLGPVKMQHFRCTEAECDFACDLNMTRDSDGNIFIDGRVDDIEIEGSIQAL